jgi:hypothetical protein
MIGEYVTCISNRVDERFGYKYLTIGKKYQIIDIGIMYPEKTPTNILSVIANLTPFSDFNQSPRNMYQCQMGKQTMGTPSQSYPYRFDNKLYRIQSPQSPIVRPKLHEKYNMDEYPNGTNAVVAVISYTGYDMEDAMILNKSSHERGFGYGTVYKSSKVEVKGNFGLIPKFDRLNPKNYLSEYASYTSQDFAIEKIVWKTDNSFYVKGYEEVYENEKWVKKYKYYKTEFD